MAHQLHRVLYLRPKLQLAESLYAELRRSLDS